MKNKMYYTIAFTFVMLAMILTATFAFFTSPITTSNILTSVQVADAPIFTAYTDGDIAFDVLTTSMTTTTVSTTSVGSDSANINTSLLGTGVGTSSCTYDLVWEWTSTDRYESADVTLPYSGTDATFNYEFSVKVDSNSETDLSSLTWSNHKAVIYSGTITNTSASTLASNVHKVTARIYNIDYLQNNIIGKSFSAKVYTSNVSCV